MLRTNGLAAVGEIPPELARALCGMSGNSVQLCHWLTYAGRAGQPGGKGWIRLSPRGVQEGQEVDPVQPPARNPQRGTCERSRRQAAAW